MTRFSRRRESIRHGQAVGGHGRRRSHRSVHGARRSIAALLWNRRGPRWRDRVLRAGHYLPGRRERRWRDADVREVLFSGFGVGEMWTRINNPRWGLDNWIYGVSGMNSGGSIRGPHLASRCGIGSDSAFGCGRMGVRFEPESGWTHGFGQAFDDWGDRFLVTNQQHVLHVVRRCRIAI